jgi:hypothetical protein
MHLTANLIHSIINYLHFVCPFFPFWEQNGKNGQTKCITVYFSNFSTKIEGKQNGQWVGNHNQEPLVHEEVETN